MEAGEINTPVLKQQLTESLPEVMVANWILWIPAQYINFYACPVKFQVLFVNLIELGWNCYLSFAASGGGHGHASPAKQSDEGLTTSAAEQLHQHLKPPVVECEAAAPHRVVNEVPVKLEVELTFEKNDEPETTLAAINVKPVPRKVGFQKDAEGYFYDILPNSQVFQPKYDWPMWDTNWDDREPTPVAGEDETAKQLERRKKRYLRKNGVTRHIILVRHGQYDETHKVRDESDVDTDDADGSPNQPRRE